MTKEDVTSDVMFADSLAEAILEWLRDNKRITFLNVWGLILKLKALYDAWRKN